MSNAILSNSQNIIKHIARLTEIRDMDVFEPAFLKVISELITNFELAIYKFKSINGRCRILRAEDSIKIEESKVEIPSFIKQAKQYIDLNGGHYMIEKDSIYTLVYPILGLHGVVGYLAVKLQHVPTDEENQIIQSLLSISHNFHNLLEENQTDQLTGLLNRKTFDENVLKIQNILMTVDKDKINTNKERRINGDENEFWLVILDIDNFKLINDNYGHVYGDEVLLILSKLMKKSFRPSDLLFRYGGEEFIVIVEVRDMNTANDVFERFRLCVNEFKFPQIGTMTISLGATQFSNVHDTAATVIGRADQALYFAKDNGKNRLDTYEILADKGHFTHIDDDGDDLELF